MKSIIDSEIWFSLFGELVPIFSRESLRGRTHAPSLKLYVISTLCLLFTITSCTNSPSIQPVDSTETLTQSQKDSLKIELGRTLFFDKNLSTTGTVSCASCHDPKLAFTDGLKTSKGIHDSITDRNSPSLLNSKFLTSVMMDAELPDLERQVLVPLQEHNEMGNDMKDLIERIQHDVYYDSLSRLIFDQSFNSFVLTRSIAAFERSLISMNSNFDKFYFQNKENAISDSEKEGWRLFNEEMNCTQCHSLPYFSNFEARNNGFFEHYTDKGRYRVTGDSTDIGKFKVPSLRNVTLTAPYMHNGEIESLDEILMQYSKGNTNHWNKDSLIQPFDMSSDNLNNLLEFLHTLVDTSYIEEFR